MATQIKSTVQIKEVMTRNPTCISTTANLKELAQMLEWDHVSGLPVVDDQERVIGVVSKSDVVRMLLEGPADGGQIGLFDLLEEVGRSRNVRVDDLASVEEMVTGDPITAREDETLSVVARRMVDEKVHRVVVVDAQRRPIGIVTTLDLLKRLA